jgi:UDP-2,3-diacylglucosamine hydrolase
VPAEKPVLVASDVHLGATHPDQERAFMAWLEYAADAASWLVVNGDLFDFWFEYRSGVPDGYEEVLARLREMTSSGLPVTLMGGNHDWWGGAFLRNEIGVEFLQAPVVRDMAGHRVLLAHGDGLGQGDVAYRYVLRPVLRSPVTRFAFGMLPIPLGDRLAGRVSRTERRWDRWESEEQRRSDALEAWATRRLLDDAELDLVLLGHTHLPMAREVAPGRWYVNSGDWVFHRSYVALRPGEPPEMCHWNEEAE